MAMSTQIIFVSFCCLVADSYLFTLDFFDGEDHFRIPIGLPDPFKLYPGMFDQPRQFISGHHHHHRPPFTSEVTTDKKNIEDKAVSTESPLATTENSEDDIFVTEPINIEHEPDSSLKDSVKTDDEAKIEEFNEFPKANTLSIHEEPILSVTIPDEREKRTTEVTKDESAATAKDTVDTIKQNNESDPGLTKNTDYLIIPVKAVNPTVINPGPNLNADSSKLTPMAGIQNGLNFNQGYPMNGFNNVNPNVDNNVNPNLFYADPNLVNSVPYGNQPIQYGNGISPQYNVPNQVNPSNPNLYKMVTIPNNMQAIPFNNNNLYYLNNGNPNVAQPNSPQLYNLVPINNYPNNPGANQQNNFYPNNQPNNFIPNSFNQPNNVPYNNVPNTYVPINQPNNFIPANNNYIPVSNQPNNFVNPNFPMNQPNNYIPYYNNQPNNLNGQPNYAPNSFNNQPNNFLVNNNAPNNIVPYQGNFIPLKDQNDVAVVNNDGTSQTQPQPIVALVALNEKDEDVSTTPKSEEQEEVIVAKDN